MDPGSLIWLILAILGAALIVGGIVAYRGSEAVGVRAFAAAAVAAGVVMWAIIVLTVPVSATGTNVPPGSQGEIIAGETAP